MVSKKKHEEITYSNGDIRFIISYTDGVRDELCSLHNDSYTCMYFSERDLRRMYEMLSQMSIDGMMD